MADIAPQRAQYRARVVIEPLDPRRDTLVIPNATVEMNYSYHLGLEVAIVAVSGAADSVADSEGQPGR